MNGEWFEAKIKYEKEQENGLMKKVSENYLVDALTFSEAEARIIEELRPYMRGEFEVADLKKVRYVELMDSENEEDDLWFKGKLVIITLDEKTAKEKKSSVQVLVKAHDIRSAIAHIEHKLGQSMMDFTVTGVTETPIIDVYKFKA